MTRRDFIVGGLSAVAAGECLSSPVRASLGAERNNVKAPLPYDAEVEYLETSGTQYFKFPLDTSKITRSLTGVCRVRYFDAGNGEQDIYGIDESLVSGRFQFRYFMWWRNSFMAGNRDSSWHDITYQHDISGCKMIIDGVETTSTLTNQFNYSQEFLWVFCSGLNRMMAQVQLGSLKFLVDGQMVGDLTAVRFTNEQGMSEGAMYDSISGALFRNAGTGSFVIGPEV